MAADNVVKNSRETVAAVRDVERAFRDLSASGTVTNQTLDSITMSLSRMGPVGIGASLGLSLIEGQLQGIAAAGIQDISNSFRDFSEAILAHAQAEAAAAGTSGALRNAILSQKDAEADLAKLQSERSDILKNADDATKSNLSIWNLLKNGIDDVTASELGLTQEAKAQLLENAKQTEAALERVDSNSKEATSIRALLLFNQQWILSDKEKYALDSQRLSLSEQLIHGAGFEAEAIQTRIRVGQQMIAAIENEMREKSKLGQLTAEETAQDLKSIAALQREQFQLQATAEATQELGTVLLQFGTGAFDAYAAAIDKTISIQNLLSENTGRAMQNVASGVLKSLGQQAVGKAMMATADGIVAFAIGDAASGTADFEAAGIYLALAALAGVGAGALSVNSGSSRSAGGGGTGRAGGGDTVNQYITVIGTLDDSNAQNLQQQLARARQKQDLDS